MADVELLPLPEPNIGLPGQVKFAYSPDLVDKAIRANVEAATAKLRAEVRDLRKRQAGWERHVAAAGCEYVRDGEHDALVNRRAERLLEALRKYGQHDDTCGVNRPGQIRCTCGFSAAIQDQEDGNG